MQRLQRRCWVVLFVLVLSGTIGLSHYIAYADVPYVQDRYDKLSSSIVSSSANNLIGFTITDISQPLGSIELQFCEESPLPGQPCTTPAGLDATAAVISAQSGNTGFSIAGNSTINTLILTRSPSIPTTDPNTYELDNIINPSAQGSYYLRIYIYPTTDGSGAATEEGGIALATASGVTISSVVPPYLKFCAGLQVSNYDCSTATSYLINFGDFSNAQPSIATSQFTVTTNAQSGYNVYATGPSLTSGNNVIANLSVPTPSIVGASQFGINLRSNSSPAVGADAVGPGVGQVTSNYDIPNRYTYNDGDSLVTSPSVSDNQTFTISYVTNVSANQPPGVYATTLTFICLANF